MWDISLLRFDASGREIARRDKQSGADDTHLAHQCMDSQLMTVGIASLMGTGGAYTIHAQARIYTPPLGAIPVPAGATSTAPKWSALFAPMRAPGCAGRTPRLAPFPPRRSQRGWPHNGANHPMAVCRAYSALANARPGDWQVLPGKISQGRAGCYVGVNGDEVIASSHEVLVRFVPTPAGDPLGDAKFVAASAGSVPLRAIEGGMGASPQYICLAAMPNDGTHGGRIAANGQGCSVAWAGKENVIKEYQALARP